MKLLLVLFVVVTFFATGEAIKCYVCSSSDKGCDDPFDESGVVKQETRPESTNCTKMVLASHTKTYTVRGFAIAGKAHVSRDDWVVSTSVATYYCDTDLCNGGTSIAAALSTLMTLTIMLISTNC